MAAHAQTDPSKLILVGQAVIMHTCIMALFPVALLAPPLCPSTSHKNLAARAVHRRTPGWSLACLDPDYGSLHMQLWPAVHGCGMDATLHNQQQGHHLSVCKCTHMRPCGPAAGQRPLPSGLQPVQ